MYSVNFLVSSSISGRMYPLLSVKSNTNNFSFEGSKATTGLKSCAWRFKTSMSGGLFICFVATFSSLQNFVYEKNDALDLHCSRHSHASYCTKQPDVVALSFHLTLWKNNCL